MVSALCYIGHNRLFPGILIKEQPHSLHFLLTKFYALFTSRKMRLTHLKSDY